MSVYRNDIRDFIYRQPVPDEPVLTIAGAFPLIRYQQTHAVLTGLDASITVLPFSRMQWTSRASILRARNKTLRDWLILMPADRMGTELLYELNDSRRLTKTYFSAEIQHVFRQSRTPDERNGRQDYKEAPDGYTLVHLNASTTLHWKKQPISFSVSVRNLLNTAYRDYLNSMRYFTDEMGRNINFRITIPFENI
jgi:iron complex outermembrane receptor protein